MIEHHTVQMPCSATMLEDVSAIDVASIRETTDKMRKSFEAELLIVKRCNVWDVKLPCGGWQFAEAPRGELDMRLSDSPRLCGTELMSNEKSRRVYQSQNLQVSWRVTANTSK
jgi:hypothetical protein